MDEAVVGGVEADFGGLEVVVVKEEDGFLELEDLFDATQNIPDVDFPCARDQHTHDEGVLHALMLHFYHQLLELSPTLIKH